MLRVADIIRVGAEGYLRSRIVPTTVHKAIRAILSCRTSALGGHAGVCPSGHVSVWYNACRQRCCPRCAYYRVRRWLERQARILLGCAHHHVIFTVPHDLNPLWQLNQAVLGDLLFTAARDALFGLAADVRYLGARPGALMALHTWGQQLTLHPHIHCLVTAGGVDETQSWVHCRRRHFLPAEPLKRLFRGKFLDGLSRLAQRRELRLPDPWTVSDVQRLTRQLQQKRWNVRVQERYEDPTAVLNYLGRYINGGPFGEGRLVQFDGQRVCFRYKDYRLGQKKVMALTTIEFVRRYLQHVPPEGFHMVRGYGLYRRGSQNNHLRDQAAEAVPLTPQVQANLVTNPPEPLRPTAGQTPCATCGVPVRLIAEIRPSPFRARPSPVAA